MLFITVAFFVLGQVFTKLVLLNQIAANQQLKGIIYSGPADVEFLFQYIIIKGFGLKMVVAAVYLFKYMKALVGFAKVLLLKVSRENVFYLLNLVRSVS